MSIPSFLFGGDAISSVKTDLTPPPAGYDPTRWWTAADWNATRTAMLDMATTLGTQVVTMSAQVGNILTPDLTKGCTLVVKSDINGSIDNPTGTVDVGTVLRFIITQDGTGGHTVVWGSHYSGTPRVNPGANSTTAVEFILSTDGTTWKLIPRTTPVFNIRDYGAVGNGVVDDTVAIQNAINAAKTAGGGIVYFPNTGSYYGISATLLHGNNFVNMGDVTLVALGFPNAGSYSAQSATSFNSSLFTANYDIPHVSFQGEPGAAIGWIGGNPGAETPMIYYAAQPDGASTKSMNVVNAHIRGLTLLGPDSCGGGAFIKVDGTTAVTSNVSGIFVPVTGKVNIEDNTLYGLKRAIVTSDNYWSTVGHNSIFRAHDGITVFSNNAALLLENVVNFVSANGYILNGQGFRAIGCHTEEAPCAINIPAGDDFYLGHCYLESTANTDTDTYIKLGQNGNGTNITWGVIENITLIPGVNARHMLMQSCFGVTFVGCRFRYSNLTNNASRINDVNCFGTKFIGTNIPLDSTTQANSTIMNQTSFYGASYDGTNFIFQPGTTADKFQVSDFYPLAGQDHRFHGALTTQAARNINRRNVTTDTTLDSSYEYVSLNTNAVGNVTATLPTAASASGRRYTLQRVGSNDGFTASVARSGSDTISMGVDGYTSLAIPFGTAVTLYSDGGVNWYVENTEKRVGTATASLPAGSLVAGATTTITVSTSGLFTSRPSFLVSAIGFDVYMPAGLQVSGVITAQETVTVTLTNPTGSPITIPTGHVIVQVQVP